VHTIRNDTDIPQVYYDAGMNAVILQPGESAVISTDDRTEEALVVKSIPPKGKYEVVNVYVDPKTGRMTVEYDDTSK